MLIMVFCLTGGVAIGWMFLGPLIASVLTKWYLYNHYFIIFLSFLEVTIICALSSVIALIDPLNSSTN